MGKLVTRFAKLDLERLRRSGIFLILVVVILNAGVFFTGYSIADDSQYLRAAFMMMGGERLPWEPIGYTRLGITVPAMVAMKITGNNLFGVGMFFCLFHILLVVGVYKLAASVSGNTSVALLAAFLSAILPHFVNHSTMVMPDVPLACYLVYALFFLILSGKLKKNTKHFLLWKLTFASLSGIFLVLAYLVKATALVALPVLVFIAWVDECLKQRKVLSRGFLLVAVALGSVLIIGIAGETVVLSHLTGETRLSMSVTSAAIGEMIESDHPAIKPILPNLAPLSRLKLILGQLDDAGSVLKWLFIAALLLCPILTTPSWRIYVMFFWLFAYLTWGSMSFRHYMPHFVGPRYCIPFLAFGCVSTAILLQKVFLLTWNVKWLRPKPVKAVLIVVACGVMLTISVQCYRGMDYRLDSYRRGEVHTAFRVLDDLLAEDSRSIVLSAEASYALEPFFFGGPLERVVPTRRETKVNDILSYWDHPAGCYYLAFAIEEPEEAQRRWGRANELDRLVRESTEEGMDLDPRVRARPFRRARAYRQRTNVVESVWFPHMSMQHDRLPYAFRDTLVWKLEPSLETTARATGPQQLFLTPGERALRLVRTLAPALARSVPAAGLIQLGNEYASMRLYSEAVSLYRTACAQSIGEASAERDPAHRNQTFARVVQTFFEDVKRIPASAYGHPEDWATQEILFLLRASGGEAAFSLPAGKASDCGLVVLSAGADDGKVAKIYVNGKNVSPAKRGYNIAVLDERCSRPDMVRSFDLYSDPANAQAMANFLNEIPPGRVVAVAVCDEGARNLTPAAARGLIGIGASPGLRVDFRDSLALIGSRGLTAGTALETRSPRYGGPALVALLPRE